MTLEQIETALDSGKLEANVGGGRWWRCRRNGRTRLWKTRPGQFQIPVKAGFRATGYVDHTNTQPGHDAFRIAD